jgi:ATP-dependent DNA helicase DinG
MDGVVDLASALDAAVHAVGGQQRAGQQRMAEAVANAIATHEHLLVQAGTGTGKSLAYLVPAVLHSTSSEQPVIVATATIALQRQLVERDLPRVVDALEPLLDRRPQFAILKGRHHYLCLHRLNEGPADPGLGRRDRDG